MRRNLKDEKLRDFFESALRRSGYPLQNIVEAKLRSTFNVQREVLYIDYDQSKTRATDLIAIASIPDLSKLNQKKKHVVGQLQLIIECKSLPDHGWIFFRDETEQFALADKVSLTDRLDPDPTNAFLPIPIFPELYNASGYVEIIYKKSDSNIDKNHKVRSNGRNDNLYSAIQSLTKGTSYQVKYMNRVLKNDMMRFVPKLKKIVAFAVFQPVIIFHGHMYGNNIIGQETKIERIQYAQIAKRYVSESYDEIFGMIHVVSYDSLDQYLQLLRKYYWFQSDMIVEQQQILLRHIDRITPKNKWLDFAPT